MEYGTAVSQRTLFADEAASKASETEVGGNDWTFLRLAVPPTPVANARRVLRAADLFCGCGGLSLGVREACRSLGVALEIALAVDSDESAAACFERNFPDATVRASDVGEILDGRISDRLTPREKEWAARLGPLDLLVGGPPCQGHSDLNNFSRRSDPKNNLYLFMGRAAEVWNPRHVLVENVVGVKRAKQNVVGQVADRLARLGYFVDEGFVDLRRLGVPQSRRRHVLLASREKRIKIEEVQGRCEIVPRDLRWAIGDLEDQPPDGLLDQAAVSSPENRARIAYLFDHDLFDLPNKHRPSCHRDKQHSYQSIYGRLRWDKPAQTVTTGFYSMPMGRYVHPSRRRTLTAHEAARLQFFPDYFDFSNVKNRTSLARMIGNAVPMKLSYVFARELFATEAVES
jgi:DNA (cytosine-5)-methyltransferase 1